MTVGETDTPTQDIENKLLQHSSDSYHETVDKATYRATNIRWLALALSASVNFGSYYAIDNVAPIQKSLCAQIGFDTFEYGWLYSAYSFPNIVLPFFGGLIIDKIGVRVALVCFSALLILGHSVVTYGVYIKSYPLMIVGRVIFGFGGESLGVAQSSVTAKWFLGKELAFAMGITLCVARLGSSLNSSLTPKIVGWTHGDLWTPFVVGVGMCCLSWIGACMLTILDRKADEQEGITTKNTTDESDKIRLSDFKNLGTMFYLLLFNCFFIYGAFFGLTNVLNALMSTRFGFTEDTAGDYIPIIYVCSAVITPTFGLFTDKYGKRGFFMLIASVVFFFDHLYIAFLNDTPANQINYGMVGALFGVGLFYSTYAAVFWPCVPLVVKENMIGTAYGIITALQNGMLALVPLIVGKIQVATQTDHGGYFYTEIFLACLTAIGIIITAFIFTLDMKGDKKFDKPTRNRSESARKSSSRSFSYK